MRSRHLLLVVIFAGAIAGLILWTVDFSGGVRERDQRASVNSPVAHDTSGRLAPPADEREDAEDDADEESQQRGGGAPAAPPKNAAGAAVEQTAHGTRPQAALVRSFDGLGVGFEGPHGISTGRNPSDNSLAVGPNHVFQIVNSRMAIFDKTGKILYGAVPTNTLFAGFTGTCESRNNGDAVVRYDQLADRWLVVMPIFGRAETRPDQPADGKPASPRTSARPASPASRDAPRSCSCRRPRRRRHRAADASTRRTARARSARAWPARAAPAAGPVLDVLRHQPDVGSTRRVPPLRIPAPALPRLPASCRLARRLLRPDEHRRRRDRKARVRRRPPAHAARRSRRPSSA